MFYWGSVRMHHGNRFPALFVVFALILSLPACETFSSFGEASSQQGDIDSALLDGARSAEANGEHAVAAGQYQKLYAKDRKNRDVVLGLARNLRYLGRTQEAEGVLAGSDEFKSGDPAVILEYAKIEISKGAAVKALGHLTTLQKTDPLNWDVYSTLGIAYDMTESFHDARQAYEKGLELAPSSPALINNMALSIALSGNLDEAIQIMEDASLVVRRNEQVRQNLALLYGLKGDERKSRAISGISLDEESIRSNLAVYSKLRGGKLHSQN